MPSPREIALTQNKPPVGNQFAEEPNDEALNPAPKEPEYRADPQNPPDGKPPVK